MKFLANKNRQKVSKSLSILDDKQEKASSSKNDDR